MKEHRDDAVPATKAAVLKAGLSDLISILTRTGLRLMSVVGPSRQAAFYGSTVANGALRTWLGVQLAPHNPSRTCNSRSL